MQRRFYQRKRYIIPLAILALLIVGRLLLPYFVTRYVNKVLADIPGYWGKIDDVDIHLYRGAYKIQGLELYKVEGNQRVPFLDFPDTDLSIYWKAILKGEVAGQIVFNQPKVNFIGGKDSSDVQSGEDVDWTAPLKKLMPLQIDRLTIKNGEITFNDFTSRPKVDLNMKNVDMLATNLSNAEHKAATLPSDVRLTAQSIGNGNLDIKMAINVLKPMPDFDLNLKFEKVDIPALNDFFEAYANVDLEKGNFDMYSELALRNGVITGYVKPIAKHLKFIDWKDKEETQNVPHLLWEGLVGLVADIFKNHRKDQLATSIPISGTIKKTRIDTWTAVLGVLRNAFVKAVPTDTDGTVTFTDAINAYRNYLLNGEGNEVAGNKKDEKEERKEERKEKRKEKREEKRKERQAKRESR